MIVMDNSIPGDAPCGELNKKRLRGVPTKKRSGKSVLTELEVFLQGIEPVGKNKSMAQVVYKTLKDAIVNGNLKPGQRLVEQKISDKMQVSRVPVREAMKRLEHGGFLQKLPVRGVIVKKISDKDIREAFGVRAALEGYASYLACERATQGLLSALKRNIDVSMVALSNGDLAKVVDLHAEFDEMIYMAAGSKVLYNLVYTFLDHVAQCGKPRLGSETDARVFLEGHKALLVAMLRGDRENAERITKSNILQERNLVLREADLNRHATR
jgi:DNA-binding GntR family transcriptional regulator